MLRAVLFVAALAGACWATDPVSVPPSEFDCTGKSADYYYPSPTDCTLFYRCFVDGSDALRYQCDPGSVFYEPIQNCDWYYHIPPPCGNSTTIPSYTTTSGAAGATTTTEKNPFYCQVGMDGPQADPNCCTKYYVCNPLSDPAVAAIPQYCPTGLAFNPAAGYCDFPSNVPGCETLVCID